MKILRRLFTVFCFIVFSIATIKAQAFWMLATDAATLTPTTANLGIGLASTTANKLTLQTSSSTQNGLRIYNSAGSTTLFSHYNGGLSVGSSTMPPSNGLYMAGNIGLNNSNPLAKIHMKTASGDVGIYLDMLDNPGGKCSPMIIWDARKGGAGYFFALRQEDNFLVFNSYIGGPFSYTGRKELLTMNANGNIGIGVFAAQYKLDVAGIVRAHEIRVCLNQGCDYVFADDYKLMNLSDLGSFVKTNKHLPDVAPAAEMESEGINVSEMNALLLKKIEELTLYVIELKNEIENLKK